jgi:hypothetical protein
MSDDRKRVTYPAVTENADECPDCDGTGEIVTINRKTLPCPTCISREHREQAAREAGKVLADMFHEAGAIPVINGEQTEPVAKSSGRQNPSVCEMALSGAIIRRTKFGGFFFVDWGNAHFSSSLQGLSNLGHDLTLFVSREARDGNSR